MTDKLTQAINAIVKAGGQPNLIGGAVRDLVLGVEAEDLDIEVFGLTFAQLEKALSPVAQLNIDDRKFGVIRCDLGLKKYTEFVLPRKDNDKGKKGFGGVYPNLTVKEASLRRDYSINALSQDMVTGEILDPLGGLADLEARILRHCDDTFFKQDPLRAIRGFRFAGQLNATAHADTARILVSMVPEVKALSGSAMWSEFEKWATRSVKPSMGLRFLVDTGLIVCFPELKALMATPQDPVWHPEGNVFEHTCHAVDQASGKGLVVVLGALCHDLAKAGDGTFRSPVSGRWVSPNHAQSGEVPTRSFLERIGAPKKVIEAVVTLVKEHMIHVGNNAITERQARRLVKRMNGQATLDQLALVIEADHSARPPLEKGMPDMARLIIDLAKAVEAEVKPVLLGRHLIKVGLTPGPHFGPLLDQAEQAQLDGLVKTPEDGIKFLRGKGLI